MAFVGANQICTACNKTVYLVDQLAADNRFYHKACFRCHHCKGTLKLGNFNSFEGVLYCRPHFDQLFKRTGSLQKSFEGTPKLTKPERTIENENAAKVSSLFGGTTEKCVGCSKTVYPTEKVTVNGSAYHKSCFKCSHGGCTISPSNYIAHEGVLYCKHHHIQLFKTKGNYTGLKSEDNEKEDEDQEEEREQGQEEDEREQEQEEEEQEQEQEEEEREQGQEEDEREQGQEEEEQEQEEEEREQEQLPSPPVLIIGSIPLSISSNHLRVPYTF